MYFGYFSQTGDTQWSEPSSYEEFAVQERRINASAVKTAMGEARLVHHATGADFDISEMAPFTHFGTRQAARQRMSHIGAISDPDGAPRLISAFLDIRTPLTIEDVDEDHSPQHYAELIADKRPDLLPGHMIDELLGLEPGQIEEYLVDTLIEAGIDGLNYVNRHEDAGNISWVALRPSQVMVLRDGPLDESLDPWELSEEAFTGPYICSEVFSIDGRCEEYEHLWETLNLTGVNLPVLARDAGGWEARWIPDWEPLATMGFFSPDGLSRGFYMGGQLWIDEAARGAGRSALMINAAADILGGCPAQNSEGMGFSPAGVAAHRSAWRLAQASKEPSSALNSIVDSGP